MNEIINNYFGMILFKICVDVIGLNFIVLLVGNLILVLF